MDCEEPLRSYTYPQAVKGRELYTESMQIQSKKGFTLIELLIVVAIIGILASVIIVGLAPAQRGGRDARRVADLRQVQTALELYYQKNQTYPAAAQCGTVSFASDACWIQLSEALKGAGVGITSIPDDPKGAGNQHYSYVPLNNGRGYRVFALLEDNNTSSSILKSSVQDTVCGKAWAATGGTVYCAGQ